MLNKLTEHWPEYLMEAAGLGTFMVSACTFATILEYPGSPIRQTIADPIIRRALMGLAMGLTAIGIIYSPWGKQSGAHINPSITMAFLRLGKIEPWDAVFYMGAQFVGGLSGVLLIAILLGNTLADPSVNYVVTIPGTDGTGIAFLAELVISFILMSVVLVATNTQNLARWTGLFAGIPVATYITVEAPLSGMSMNPARTFAAALPAQLWTALWVYFAAPIVGMLLAVELYLRLKGAHEVFSAKLQHQNNKRGIFKCGYPKVTEPVVESKRPPENGQEPKMGYVNSVLMGVSKCPNPT
ncbi:MAG: aquaporin, partial [Deltaproteobacteria bacterium]|nr:aquaporin [Deltaproteobacteria bacterium]